MNIHKRNMLCMTNMILCVAIAVGYAGNDSSLPEGVLETSQGIWWQEHLSGSGKQPPIIGSFPAPDGAIRGAGFDGTYLWLANSGDGNSTQGPRIYRVDADDGTVINMFNGPCSTCSGLAWDGQYLWHSDYTAQMIYQLDTASMTVMKSFPTYYPFDIAFDGTYIYSVNGNTPIISIRDTATGTEVGTVNCLYSFRPVGLTYFGRAPWSSELWTSDGNYGSNYVHVWDFIGSEWVDEWQGNPTNYPCGLAYDSLTDRVWITDWNKDSVWIYDVSDIGSETSDYGNIDSYSLRASPNPFSKKTVIRCSMLARPASQGEAGDTGYKDVELKIYDVSGRLVKEFSCPTPYALRSTHITWDGTDEYGYKLPAGVYFLTETQNIQTVKVIKLR